MRYLSGTPLTCMCLLSVIWGEGNVTSFKPEYSPNDKTNHQLTRILWYTNLPCVPCKFFGVIWTVSSTDLLYDITVIAVQWSMGLVMLLTNGRREWWWCHRPGLGDAVALFYSLVQGGVFFIYQIWRTRDNRSCLLYPSKVFV